MRNLSLPLAVWMGPSLNNYLFFYGAYNNVNPWPPANITLHELASNGSREAHFYLLSITETRLAVTSLLLCVREG